LIGSQRVVEGTRASVGRIEIVGEQHLLPPAQAAPPKKQDKKGEPMHPNPGSEVFWVGGCFLHGREGWLSVMRSSYDTDLPRSL
jgi:hypothetical protein